MTTETPERWRQVAALFDEAVKLAPERRGEYLVSACGGDADLHRRVVELLEASGQAADFLERPVVSRPVEVLGRIAEALEPGPAPPPEDPRHSAPTQSGASLPSDVGLADSRGRKDMTNPVLAPGARMGHFTIVSLLGAGGMGEVYRASDERLKREVALKVLPQQAMAEPDARARLLREARSAAALNHPHICTIYEVGEEQGQDYIAMELVDGRPLNELGGVAGYAPTEIVRIGIEVAEALAHAHERGIVHRDLKSANVMMTSDARVKVMDFGLARLVPTADANTVTAASLSLTGPGTIMGTMHYLPPEVLSGAEADARGDIWALGVLLHELAAREMPFDGHTRFEVAAAIMHSPPRSLPGSVPLGLRTIIARCLEKEPARRYQRAGEVRAALEAVGSDPWTGAAQEGAKTPKAAQRPRPARMPVWPIAGLGLGLLVVAALVMSRGAWMRDTHGTTGADSRRSLAVLPLENLSRDPEQAYFADGMTEEISTRLAQISALRVIGQSSVSDLVTKQKSLPEIGRALGVPVLLRGSVFRAADQVKITVQLVKAATGELMWAESYERSLMDVLSLQSEVALAIAREIQVHLTPQEHTRLATSRQIDPEAYQAYLKGRALWNEYKLERFQEAERQFRHAIEIAPDYAPAWAGLADALYGMSSIFVPANDAIPRARAAAEKALALDGSLAEAHTSLGIIKVAYDWDWAGAEREFDRAIALGPGNSNAHMWRGKLLVMQGRFDDGIASIRQALDLDPLNSWFSASLGWHLYFARRYDEALAHLQKAMTADPGSFNFHVFLGLVLEQKGDHSGAIAALEKAVALSTNNDDLAELAHVYGTAGRRQDAEREIAKLLERRKNSFVPAGNIAFAYAGLGDHDDAFRWLDLAIQDHSEFLDYLKVEPGFDPIRSDPRFAQVLRRIHLLD
jgi:serine/threonine-protein kinase